MEAGIGGGGIVSAVWVITSEIVEVRRRAIWSQALSITWSCSAIAGPLIGGFFSGNVPIAYVQRYIKRSYLF
jgi:MFS family permease